jgi:hypothetical protein
MSYADELGEMLLSLVDDARKEDRMPVLELAVATARRAVLEVPEGYKSVQLKEVASIHVGTRVAKVRIRSEQQGSAPVTS